MDKIANTTTLKARSTAGIGKAVSEAFAPLGYRFGFNGQHKDNEIKGIGNSLDFGARMYDSRLGRWLSLDPLQKKYPSLSAYHFSNNNPIYFKDFEGKYFTGSTKDLSNLQIIYSTTCQLGDKGNPIAQAFKARLEAMDNSDVEYHMNGSAKNLPSGDAGGQTYFDVRNNRVNMDVLSDDAMADQQLKSTGDNEMGRMAHELNHGGQFEDLEILYAGSAKEKVHNKSYVDLGDEHQSSDVGYMITNATGGIFTEAQLKDLKESYDNNSEPFDIKTKNAGTDLATSPAQQIQQLQHLNGKNRKIDSKANYTPTDKQKAEKKSVLSKPESTK